MLIKRLIFSWFLIGIQICCSTVMIQHKSKLLLFDFQNATDLNNWSEQSDTVRSAGRSKATFDLYRTQTNQSAILFTLLNPLPNGACFGGVRTATHLNLYEYQYISFTCIATGNATTYKIILRHNNLNDEPNPTFEQKFQVNSNAETIVKLNISQFEPYYRGKVIVDGPTLNVKNITSFGIQVAGGVYETFKQSGLSSLLVNRIWAEPYEIKN